MIRHGRAAAPGAGTVVNALATGRGSAFALDLETTATVELDPTRSAVTGAIAGHPDEDTTLVETCVRLVLDEYGDSARLDSSVGDGDSDTASGDASPSDDNSDAIGGHVRTTSEVPPAAGLKSSSAAANAATLATLAALGESVDDRETRLAACRLGVRAAREAGVTVTGAFDDASASMLGGVTVTDNTDDALLARSSFAREAVVWTPPTRAYSAATDAARCERVAPMASLAIELARDARFGEAMTVNGLAFSAALDYPTGPAVAAMPHADGVSLSGTGPSVVAVGGDPERIADEWDDLDGVVRRTVARDEGARIVASGDGPAFDDDGRPLDEDHE